MRTRSVLVALVLQLLLLCASTTIMADPRSNTLFVSCSKDLEHNTTAYVPNFLNTMDNISNQVRTDQFGLSVKGSGPDSSYALAQCYGDLSTLDCVLCYAEARTLLPQCFPFNGGRLFLDGCFMRGENYSFFDEIYGWPDRINCTNSAPKSSAFAALARQVVGRLVMDASGSSGRFSRAAVTAGNESVYGLANCWRTVNASRCRECLTNASAALLGCLPNSGGRAMYTGCFLRFSDTDFLNNYSNGGGKVSKAVLIAAVVSTTSFAIIAIVIGTYLWKQKKIADKRKASVEKIEPKLLNSNLHFTYSALEKATGNFNSNDKLGQGGFGTVYKGVLADGREIAVKRLFFNNRHRVADFYNEVNMISSIEHKNLVRLLGCSCNGPESLLVYEYLPNKSLDGFIFDPVRARQLNWEKRMDIIVGTAEGLVYLHENSVIKIIHRDIKASNILLDSKFRAKISDFGLARSFEEDKSHISTAVAGTLGYMSPEYLAHGLLTEKVDVYSFGVLLLEIVSGVQNRKAGEEYTESLLTTAWKRFQSDTVHEMIDTNMMAAYNTHDRYTVTREACRVVHVGLLCTQEASALRPSMKRALEMLLRRDESLAPPSHPPFMDETRMEFNDNFDSSSCLVCPSGSSGASISHSSFYPR
ncbi:cysteine-rich receptor-like protein kinase 2 [Nymphaea colorata]|nr:cysteine-rich receptor-like protein kinase 2 [Nymphaea colorata]